MYALFKPANEDGLNPQWRGILAARAAPRRELLYRRPGLTHEDNEIHTNHATRNHDSETFAAAGTKERNLGLELVRVTEAAAYAASRFMGRGDKNAVDGAAVDAMRTALEGVDMHGVVVIGEGEKDEAPMLYVGEEVGNGLPPEVDVAVDPVDGTRLTAQGLPGAIAVVAIADRGVDVQGAAGRLLHGEAGGLARGGEGD